MKITLVLNNESKEFTAPSRVSGRLFRKALEYQGKFANKDATEDTNENEMGLETLDELVDYVGEVFGNQFTRDEFWDGIDAGEVLPTVLKSMEYVINKVNKVTVKNGPNA